MRLYIILNYFIQVINMQNYLKKKGKKKKKQKEKKNEKKKEKNKEKKKQKIIKMIQKWK